MESPMDIPDHKSLFAPLRNTELLAKVAGALTGDTLNIVIEALNCSINGLIVTDLTGVIRYANPSFCRMFEYASEEVIGKDAALLFSSNEIRTFSDVVAIADMSQDFSHEFIVERLNGDQLTVEVSASNVTLLSGRTVGRMASFIDITQRKTIENDREQLIKKLQNALDTIKALKGIIPICASCKKIRDDEGYWNQLETYIEKYADVHFTHGMCPECSERFYGKEDWYIEMNKGKGKK
jgi:PAS domain S-box-containing protein